MLLMTVVISIIGGSTAVALDETNLFVSLDSSWEHTSEGDTFVVRADVKNIGQYPALITWVQLDNIPEDWDVRPSQHLILVLSPDQTEPRFFVVTRGASDATIYATADAYNAPPVQSNKIAIPINLWIVVGLFAVCGIVAYREMKMRKK